MRAKVATAETIILTPENDADAALLRVFADCNVYVAGYGGRIGEPMDLSVTIRFTRKETKKS